MSVSLSHIISLTLFSHQNYLAGSAETIVEVDELVCTAPDWLAEATFWDAPEGELLAKFWDKSEEDIMLTLAFALDPCCEETLELPADAMIQTFNGETMISFAVNTRKT